MSKRTEDMGAEPQCNCPNCNPDADTIANNLNKRHDDSTPEGSVKFMRACKRLAVATRIQFLFADGSTMQFVQGDEAEIALAQVDTNVAH